MARKKKTKYPLKTDAYTHGDSTRPNIPTAEMQSVMEGEGDYKVDDLRYSRRNPDLDPQLVWRGKDAQNEEDLVVPTPPLFIQEKIHPKALVEDLRRDSEARKGPEAEETLDLFEHFDVEAEPGAETEFYQHDANWSNRMILGDALQVMGSLAEREGLRGKVQCIYIDPPYGIRFNSNFQWSTTNRNISPTDRVNEITREPEQVKAFRDTWRDGIHSYLSYIRDRLMVARDLLSESGSIFIQIGQENVHRLRCCLDEVFGPSNCVSLISVRKTATPSQHIDDNHFYVIWYAKNINDVKFRKIHRDKPLFEWVTETKGGSWGKATEGLFAPLTREERRNPKLVDSNAEVYALSKTTSAGASSSHQEFVFEGKSFFPKANTHWKTSPAKMERLDRAGRLESRGGPPWFRKFHNDSSFKRMTNAWSDTSGKSTDRVYVVQTEPEVVKRCILMCTDPGDLVLDPTCGSGTTAFVAEEWGRRWITIDTSRVALALARARIMATEYKYYLLADSKEGQHKEAELSRNLPSENPTSNSIKQGFVYERVPHITLKSIANNTEIDIVWEQFQEKMKPLREALNKFLGQSWEDWEIPREADTEWSEEAAEAHRGWWELRIDRQREIDASIAAKADYEYLYDKPYVDKKKIRVAGPFTVESLSPHRTLTVDENDELIDRDPEADVEPVRSDDEAGFAELILENLKVAGVQQSAKEDRIRFTSLTGWPGTYICAEARYVEGESEDTDPPERKAGIFIGPEFGTVSRMNLVEAAREAADAGFDVLIACAFNYDAHADDFQKLGKIQILKATMNADLHMADELKNTGAGNLFVIFGEPDIEIREVDGGQVEVEIKGVDIFHPQSGEVRSSGPDGIACWFIDTDYNKESFFVRHAYFTGQNDPYKALKTSLKAEIDEEAWESLNSTTSRPFAKPEGGFIAIKVINHLGDEVMKVYEI